MAAFDKSEAIRRALEGEDRAFLVTNSSERVEERQLRFVELARENGVRHIVYLSQLHASKESRVRFLRYHAVLEEAILGGNCTHASASQSLSCRAFWDSGTQRRRDAPDVHYAHAHLPRRCEDAALRCRRAGSIRAQSGLKTVMRSWSND